MEQPMLAGMPRRLYPCTPTRLANWLDCPRRYRMTYLDRPPPPKGPPWAHNSLGASVHNALAGWWRLPFAKRTVAGAGDLLDGGWIDQGYASDEQSAQWRESARGMVERYTATLDPATEPLGVERTVGARTEQIVLSGRVDRLDERREPGGDRVLAVVDYKTGRRPLTQDDARTSMPLALYALAAARMFRTVCRLVNCITCRPPACTPGSTPTRGSPGSCGGPRASRPSARTPTSGSGPGCPRPRWTACS